ncbi:hypothetical protein GCM10022226_70390 [Sphaerisporangium flaviroseum]|uniref:Uncharacterized protein n=1 Tax=Sphaerisporangium flaviroseum TaxID=509199 RepID=A0ABP7J8Z5_9ACTN
MDPGYIVLVVLGVLVVASTLGVALVTIVLRGIRGERAMWPVTPDTRHAPPGSESTGADTRAAGIQRGGTEEAGRREHPEWTGRELAGDDLRPIGTHEEKHALPGRARWW